MLKYNFKKIIFLLAFLCSISVFSSDYDIEKYFTNVEIKENGIFNILEQMDVKFHESRHGIIREIPLFYDNRIAKINDDNFTMNDHPFTLSTDYQVLKVKIGDPDKYANERESYIFSYDFDTFDDKDPTKDVINYNILGHFHDARIKEFSAIITLPKEINVNDIELYSGPMGEKGNPLNVHYEYDNQKREVKIDAQNIPIKNGITFRIELPEGYFVGTTKLTKIPISLIIIFSLFILILVAIIWYLFGRDKDVIFIPEIHPPKNMDPLKMGYLIDQNISNEDLTSMFYYWADKGKINITYKEDKSFTISKIAELDESESEASKLLFSTLFTYFSEDGQNITSEYIKEVPIKTKEKSKIATSILKVKKQVSKEYSGKKRLNNTFSSIVSSLTFLLSLFLFSFAHFYMYFNAVSHGTYVLSESLSSFYMISPIVFPIIMLMIGGLYIKSQLKNKTKAIINAVIGSVIISAIYVLVMVIISTADYSYFYTTREALIFFILYSIIVSITCFIIAAINKRSKYYNEQLSLVLGLKTFIEKVEIDQLKLLIDEDPNYYYGTLAYSIVLGLEQVWSKKFEKLDLNAPDWYNSTSSGFSTSVFNSAFHSMSSSLSSSLVSSSSGGSGGSSSGGGGGGGGSSSW